VVKDYLRQDQQHLSAQTVTKLSVGAEVAVNKVFHTPVYHVGSQDHKKNEIRRIKTMGDVVGLIQVMPTEILDDDQLDQLIEEIKTFVKPPAKVGNIEIKPIAFGIRGINLNIVIPDASGTGGIDPIAEEISKLENVESAEVKGVGLL
jgi:translation elongation factor aEF-1 beta